ncbi:MAG: helix-turn-helix domain-containing protein [Oscillospiraceae bacterium]|nr:helix-turn-helix domain-containing protein [Oscillospiraceae bacterium]
MPQVKPYLIDTEKVAYIDRQETISNRTALHEEIEIKCFYEGSATLLVESQTVCVKAGDVVVINPYEFHATVDTGAERGKYHLFMLPLNYFAGIPGLELQELLLTREQAFEHHFSGDKEMYGLLMQAAWEAQQDQPARDVMIKGLLAQLFALLLRRGLAQEGRPLPEKGVLRRYPVIDPAMRCIKASYAEPLTVEQLAALCGVSKHYFCRSFKLVTGKSAMEYLRHFRLRVANALLTGTNRGIAEIAVSCGFENQNYFSRCYKQHYGETPSQSRARDLNDRLDG